MNRKKYYLRFLIFLGLFTFVINPIHAKNLGVWGTLFPIVEKDIREFIYARLNNMEQNGTMKKLKEKFISNCKSSLFAPNPCRGTYNHG